MLSILLLGALLFPSGQRIEVNGGYSVVDSPAATGFTTFCEGSACGSTLQRGPKGSGMFSGGLTYFTRDHFGFYGALGIGRTARHEAAQSRDTLFDIPLTPINTSTTTATRKLEMATLGVFFSDRPRFASLYGYAGIGGLRDSFTWSTLAVQFPRPPRPGDTSTARTIPGQSSAEAHMLFQFGTGVRFYLRRNQGVQVLGEINALSSALEDPIDVAHTVPSKRLVTRFGARYFFQWQRHH
jgi:hypothetical protein